MRLAFLGSPGFAVAALDALADAGHEIAVVVTRPDRPSGRGRAPRATQVKAAAIERGIEVSEDLDVLARCDYDLAVVVAFGALVPERLLARAPMLNLHFSLLPRWRGAAPLERAILAGDERTGVCVMGLEPTLDTGPIYARADTGIDDKYLDELRGELVVTGAALLRDLLGDGPGSLPSPRPQAGEATYARKLVDAELELDFSVPASELVRVVRLGRARTHALGRRLGVPRASAVDGDFGAPGSFDGEFVACARGALRLDEVLPEGRRKMRPADWLRGLREAAPTHLGALPSP